MCRTPWRRARWRSPLASGTRPTGDSRAASARARTPSCRPSRWRRRGGRLAGRPRPAPEDRPAREARLARRRHRGRPFAGDLRDGEPGGCRQAGARRQGAGARELALDVSRPQVSPESLGDDHRPRRLHGLPGLRGRLPGREQRAPGWGRATSTTGGASSGCESSAGGIGVSRPRGQGARAGSARIGRPDVGCQHCEVAPCEPVCPVFAAYHTDEGLNGQVYNRCVGTRYCGNNCPYTCGASTGTGTSGRRRSRLQLNPTSPCAQLGVMEKCTMCVQRIVAGQGPRPRREAAPSRRRHPDRLPADVPDAGHHLRQPEGRPERVSKLSQSPRGYHVLEELGHAAGGDLPQARSSGRSTREREAATDRDPADRGRRPDLRRRQPRRPPHARLPGGNLYFGWMSIGPHPAGGILAWTLQIYFGMGMAGQAHAPDVGDVHHHVRVLDRHRPRGDADLGHPVPVPAPLAHLDLPRPPRR